MTRALAGAALVLLGTALLAGAEESGVAHTLAVEAVGHTTLGDAAVALVRPNAPGDVAANGASTTDVPRLLVLARPQQGTVHAGVARVGSESAVVVTWIDAPPGTQTGGIAQAVVWAVRGKGPLRVLVRHLPHGSDPASAPASADPETDLDAPRRVEADPRSPGVLVDVGRDPLFARLRRPAPADLPDDGAAAFLLARPTAGGRRLGAARVGSLQDGVRVRVAVPLEPGGRPWGPRAPGEADLLVVQRDGDARIEWLLEVE